MITSDGWFDWTVRVPGPPDKTYAQPNAGSGYIPHSADGFYSGWAERLFSTERRPDGRYTDYAAASVHGWIAYDGTVTQHYPLTASCWASGSPYPNCNFVAFENEGGFKPENEPFTPAQVEANVRIIRELAQWRGWNGFRRPAGAQDATANLYEHRDCTRWGSAPTACPSDRVPWSEILARLSAAPAQPSPAAVGRIITLQLPTGVSTIMDVDEYAKGVIPYEMGTGWPREALKAQAVAAKSYALAAGAVYADTRSQAYGDLRYPDTNEAVDEVRGVYLAYQGQIVMPFYSAHCNGLTRSPSEAGWNPASDRPYLQGVPCICGNSTYYGHGIGMCQRGAQALALQGATFDQILRHYYTGIELMGFDGVAAQPPPPASAQTYVVAAGDSLLAIAAKFGLDWPSVYLANRALITDPNVLQPGWQLVIPRGPVEEGQPDVYVVQPGDTLFALARAWGSTVAAIVAENGIENEGLIRVGQRLLKPKL